MADDDGGGGAAPAWGDEASVTMETMETMELKYVEEVVDFILWDTPTSMFPTTERVWRLVKELAARGDAADPILQAAMDQCWDFLGFTGKTCH